MHLNVWDSAGQQIEHATHQFFLTEGALYLILWNSRQGADSGKRDVYYWLELLRMRVPRARFLLIATHADRTPPDLPWPDIQRLSGKAFAGHREVDFENPKGFPALQDAILALAAASPSMNSRWNRKWLAVRDRVRDINKKRRYLRPEQFRELLAAEGVSDTGEQLTLAGQLHELGEILYHVHRPDLADFVLLDCEWVTELIGLVSRSSQVRENGGILRREDLDSLWPAAMAPPELRNHVLKLMDAFDLSYETTQHDEMAVVVEALPPYSGQPLPEWDAADGQPELSLVLNFPNTCTAAFRREFLRGVSPAPTGTPSGGRGGTSPCSSTGTATATRAAASSARTNSGEKCSSTSTPITRPISTRSCVTSSTIRSSVIRASKSAKASPAAAAPIAPIRFP
jgi:internalin A